MLFQRSVQGPEDDLCQIWCTRGDQQWWSAGICMNGGAQIQIVFRLLSTVQWQSRSSSQMRLLKDNMAENGSLNNDKMVRALLQQCNRLDCDCKLSPAEVLFGRGLRDSIPQLSRSVPIFQSDRIHNQWNFLEISWIFEKKLWFLLWFYFIKILTKTIASYTNKQS